MVSALLRHARLAAAPLAVVAIIVLAMSAVLAAVPALAERTATQELTDSLATLPEARRALVAETLGVPPVAIPPDGTATTESVWSPIVEALDDLRRSAGPELAPMLGEAQFAVVSGAAPVESDRRDRDWPTMTVRMLVDPAFDARIRIVDGAAPEPRGPARSPTGEPLGPDWSEPMQTMLSAESAELMRWPVGEVRVGVNGVTMQLVGVFEAIDPDDQYWEHVGSVLQPSVFDDGNSTPVITATGVVHPVELVAFTSGSTTVFMPFRSDDVTFAGAAAMGRDLQRFTSGRHEIVGVGLAAGTRLTLEFGTDALGVVDLAAARASAALATVAALAVPPVGAAVGVLAVIAAGAARLQAGPTAVARSRGASPTQVRAVAAGQAAVVAVPAAAIGAALPLVAGIEPSMPITAVGAAALAVVAIVVAAAAPIPPIEVAADRRRAGMRSRVARVVIELAIAVAAVASLVLVGVGGRPGGAAGPAVDPIAVVAPLVVAVAASLAVIRLLPWLLARLASRGRARRGLVGFVGPVTAAGPAAARGAVSASAVLVLTTVVAVAVASAAALILARIDDAMADEAATELLGDVRIVADGIDAAQLALIEGVRGVAVGELAGGVTTGVDRRLSSASVLVIDVGSVPVLAEAAADGVAVSPSMRDALDAAQVRVNGVEVVPTAVLPDAALRDLAVDLVVADAADGAGLIPGSGAEAIAIVALDPSLGAAARADAVVGIRALLPSADVAAVDERIAEVSGRPLTALLRGSLLVVALGAGALAVIGIVAAASAGAAARAGAFGILRVLGARRRELAALGAWELLPAALVSVVVGLLVGIALAWVTFAGVDLAVFVGARVPLGLAVDPLALVPVVVAVLAAVAATVVVAGAAALRGSSTASPGGGS